MDENTSVSGVAESIDAPDEESDFSPRKMKIAFAVLMGTLFGSSILPMMAFNLLLIPMTDDFGWSRTAFSGGLTAMMLGGAISAPILGRLVDKLGVRPMIIGGTVAVGLLTMGLSLQGGQLWQFYAGFAILGFTGSTAIGYSKVIGSLFTKHRGKALAIFGVESSIAGAIAPKLIEYMIANHGWRGMFVGLGVIILAVVPILLIWLEEPRAAKPTGPENAAPAQQPGMDLGAVLRTPTFWFISLASLLAMGPAFGLMPHYVPFLMSRGFEVSTVVNMISISALAMAFGTLAGGWVLDHSNGAWVAAPFSVITTLGIMALLFVSTGFGGVPLLAVAMAAIGFAGGSKRPMGTFFQLHFFGLKSFASVVGVQAPFLALGMGISPLLVGYCFDKLGSYELAIWIMTGAMAVTVLLYLILGPYRYDRAFNETEAFAKRTA